jgi:hypothetical protein
MHPSIHVRVLVLVLVIVLATHPSLPFPCIPSPCIPSCPVLVSLSWHARRLVCRWAELRASEKSGERECVSEEGRTVGVVSVWYVGQWWVGRRLEEAAGMCQVMRAREHTHTTESSRQSSTDTLCLPA